MIAKKRHVQCTWPLPEIAAFYLFLYLSWQALQALPVSPTCTLSALKSPATSGSFAVSCYIFSSLALKSSMFSQISGFALVSPPMSVPG
jgi:hypothetical protein